MLFGLSCLDLLFLSGVIKLAHDSVIVVSLPVFIKRLHLFLLPLLGLFFLIILLVVARHDIEFLLMII